MKVDKGVCTTNDAYFAGNNINNVNTTTAPSNELNSIIKFETVFTTLVENKILAIKRECEQHETKKKSRTLKNILSRKSNLTAAEESEEAKESAIDVEKKFSHEKDTTVTESRKKESKNFFFKYRKKPKAAESTKVVHGRDGDDDDDVEKGHTQSADNEQSKEVPSKVNDEDELVNVIVIPNEEIQQQLQQQTTDNNEEQGLEINRKDDNDVANAKLDSQSNELVIAADVDARNLLNLPVSTTTNTTNNSNNNTAKLITDDNEQNNCDKLIIYSQTTENAQVTQSTTINSSNNNVSNNNYIVVTSSVQQHLGDQAQVETLKEEDEHVDNLELAATTINNDNDESLATTIDISLQQSSIIVLAGELPINNNSNNNNNKNNNNNVNDKSDVAICDDGLSSQNTSDIEFSLVSENSISDLPEKLKKKLATATATTVTNSDPIIKKSVNVVSPPLTRNDKKPCHERKAKSCQSTPIFGRHSKHVRSESEGKKILTFQKELPSTKIKYETKITDGQQPQVKSQTIVKASATALATTTTTLASKSSMPAVSAGPLESVHTTKKLQKHSSKHRDVSIEYEITYDDDDDNANQSPHGFISSFNQLTSQKQPAAIISANLKKQTSKSSTRGGHGKDSSKNQHDVEKTVTNHEIELELDELNVDVVNKKKRRRSKLKENLMMIFIVF